jgi:hypothetical protein
MKFRNKRGSGMVYWPIPAHFEHCPVSNKIEQSDCKLIVTDVKGNGRVLF